MLDKSYGQMMSEAFTFTQELGLDISDVKVSHLPYPIEDIGHEILTEFLFRRKTPIQNFGFNCIPWSIEACRFLEQRYNIHAVLTSGSLFRNGKIYIHQPKEEIRVLLHKKNTDIGPAKFHTWLTLGNYIFDLTIMTTEWLIDETKNNYRYPIEKYCQIVAFDFTSNRNMIFSYLPVFLGEDFFNQVKFTPKANIFVFNSNPDPEYPEEIQ